MRLLPQLYDLPDDGWLSRAGGHGGAMGEERVVDVCVSVIYDAGLILARTPEASSGGKTLAKCQAKAAHHTACTSPAPQRSSRILEKDPSMRTAAHASAIEELCS